VSAAKSVRLVWHLRNDRKYYSLERVKAVPGYELRDNSAGMVR
jgi:hypothetical protein